MNEELEPRPYSDRELTLTSISLTFQRARAVQRELTGPPSWTEPKPEAAQPAAAAPDDSSSGVSSQPNRPNANGQRHQHPSTDNQATPDPASARTAAAAADDDVDVDSDIDDNPGSSGAGVGLTSGAERAMGLDESEEPDFPNPIVTDANFRHYLDQATAHQGPGRIKIGSGEQAHYNAAVVHALHQLDHRTRLQQRTITRLEAELADARRALAALESNELRES